MCIRVSHRVYTSIEGHYSVPKAAGLLGVGQANCVKIAVDERGQMLPQALEAAIACANKNLQERYSQV